MSPNTISKSQNHLLVLPTVHIYPYNYTVNLQQISVPLGGPTGNIAVTSIVKFEVNNISAPKYAIFRTGTLVTTQSKNNFDHINTFILSDLA